MKLGPLLSIVVLLSLVLVAVPVQLAAQATQTPSTKVLDEPMQLPNAPQRARQAAAPGPGPAAPEMAWTVGPAAPLGDPQFYRLPSTCNVLVVDDDWDFDATGPNDGGRPYYTSALDALGYPYGVWDTVTQGQPVMADMQPYDVVVWFTGYAWETGVFSPTNETEVAAYLAGGGSFMLSSQDYYYEAMTITPFMRSYLGVSYIDEDWAELDPVGNTGNPIGNGLGPYTMARPDDYAAYWPTGANEGPWDDYAYAAPGAAEPFRYGASSENNSTNLDGGTWRTAYFAWPLEWIDTVEQRAELFGQALSWLCSAGVVPDVWIYLPNISKNY